MLKFATFAFGFLVAGAALAAEAQPPAGAAAPVVIGGAQQRDIRSSVDGRDFRIFTWKPSVTTPPQGFPVIWVLDANAVFGTLVEAVALRGLRPSATGVEPSIIVGIGYQTPNPLDLDRRIYDLTPPAAEMKLPQRPDGSSWPPVGGADELLAFIETALKPMVAKEFSVDPAKQILMGHSFGGLFALHVLFTKPESFSTYIAGSPSIWFNDRHLLKEEATFAARQKAEKRKINLFIGLGEWEQELTPTEKRNMPGRAVWKAQNRMIDNGKEMAARLAALESDGLNLAFRIFPGEDHLSSTLPLISQALPFAFAPPPK